ncbi:MAG TPA: FAD-dependent oxidoreductase [Tianweitania sediminis]|nr:FAD-dependent oxidoreductase [Tianweitania sediminis]
MSGIVIIGTGEAGVGTAVALRTKGYQGGITLVGDEPHLPYRRPPLSKEFLKGDALPETLMLRPDAFFASSRIDLRTGVHAHSIDRPGKKVRLDGGETLSYEHLVLATGARNNVLPVPGHDLDGVFGLRTLDDASRLRARLIEGQSIAIVGAGFIGLEMAAAARSAGMQVHVIEAAGRVMGRAVSTEISTFFAEAHAAAGTQILLGTQVTALRGNQGKVAEVVLSDGRSIPATTVLVGIGVTPNVDLAEAAGLVVANGIVVDACLLTADPAISAIGDCARFPSAHTGDLLRVESVQNANDQSKLVANRVVTGETAPYQSLPWFWSYQGPLRLQIAGITTGYDSTVVTGDRAAGAFSVYCFRHGRLLGVESVNKPADHVAARRILERGLLLSPDEVSRADFDPKAFALGAEASAPR